MPRRLLPDSNEWQEQKLARIVSRLAIGALFVVGLVTLVLHLPA